MATWLELKQRVFSHLELVRSTTGDVETAVEEALHDTYLDLINDVDPEILFTSTSPVSLVGPAETLTLSGDFGVTDLNEIFTVSINCNPSDPNSESIAWDQLSWERWIKEQGCLPGNHWAIDPSNTFYFTTTPEDSETWEVTLHYYQQIAAYADGGSPEIDSRFHHILAYGAATMFPQYFEGERESLFLRFQAKWQNGIARIQHERNAARSFKRLRSRVKMSTSRGLVWPRSIF